MKKFAIIEIGSYNTKTPDGVYDLDRILAEKS